MANIYNYPIKNMKNCLHLPCVKIDIYSITIREYQTYCPPDSTPLSLCQCHGHFNIVDCEKQTYSCPIQSY